MGGEKNRLHLRLFTEPKEITAPKNEIIPPDLDESEAFSFDLVRKLLTVINSGGKTKAGTAVTINVDNPDCILITFGNRQFFLKKEENLGTGAHGTVHHYRGQERFLDIHSPLLDFAIKSYRTEQSSNDELETEAQKYQRACTVHPNIIQYMGHTKKTRGTGFLFLKLQPQSLSDAIKNPSHSDTDLIKITLGLLNGLHKLNQHQILHLDLKPENILIDAKGNPVITDFGCSRTFEHHINPKTNELSGTFNLLPPEMFESPSSYSPKTFEEAQKRDLWALGLLIKKMLGLNTPQINTEELESDIQRHEAYKEWSKSYSNYYDELMESEKELTLTPLLNKLNCFANCLLLPLTDRPGLSSFIDNKGSIPRDLFQTRRWEEYLKERTAHPLPASLAC